MQAHIPFNNEAEQALLGAILINQSILDDLVGTIAATDFYARAHCSIYKAMLTLYNTGIAVDVVALADQLRKGGVLEKVGGLPYLGILADSVSTSASARYHADLIKEAAMRRGLLLHCQDIGQRCLQDDQDIPELLDQAEQKIFELAENKISTGFKPISEIIQSSYKTIEKRTQGVMPGLTTGFTSFDLMTSGLHPGEFIILAGRPSMGKTAFALNVCYQLGLEGKGSAIFSLEMTDQELGFRLLTSVGHVDYAKVRKGHLSNDDHKKLIEAAEKVNPLPIRIDESPGIGLLEMKAKLRRLQRQMDISLIVIDYLQLMKPGHSRDIREREVAELSAGLKAMAKTFKVPVLVLSQLNRKVEDRPKRRPELQDLRESGSLEQDADLVFFLYRPEFYNPIPENKGIAEVIIAKQRNGPIGTVKLTFLDKFTRFENYQQEI
jgi:replicative DNA helicase